MDATDAETSGHSAGWSHGNYAEHVEGIDVGRFTSDRCELVAQEVGVSGGFDRDPATEAAWRHGFAAGLTQYAEDTEDPEWDGSYSG